MLAGKVQQAGGGREGGQQLRRTCPADVDDPKPGGTRGRRGGFPDRVNRERSEPLKPLAGMSNGVGAGQQQRVKIGGTGHVPADGLDLEQRAGDDFEAEGLCPLGAGRKPGFRPKQKQLPHQASNKRRMDGGASSSIRMANRAGVSRSPIAKRIA